MMGSAADTLPKELNLGDGFNRYKFQSFRNRIEKLDVHVARRVVRNLDEPKDDTGSYFGEALASWIELNCTSDFTSFCREVRPITTSLAQLLYHKDTVVDAVEKHITKPGSLALEPLLSLTTSLAQDLQEEFYPYYLRCMGWLIPLARSPDAAVVEWVYNTIAYLFKYLTKTILTDFNTTFLAISPLLGSERQKSHAKRFAAESLSYLLRKLKGKELQSAIGFIVHSLVESSSVTIDGYCEGLALLFFECMKNVDRQLHSKAPRIFQVLLEELYKEDLEPAKPSNNHVFRLAETTWKLCLHYIKPDGSEPLWRVVYQDFDRATGKGHDSEDATNETRLLSIVSLFATGAALRKADRVDDVSQLATRAERCLDIYFGLPNMPDGEAARTNVTLMGELARLVAALLLHSPLDTVLSSGRLLLDRIFATGDARIVLSLSTTLVTMKWQHTSQLLLPHLVRYIGDNWQTSLEEILLLLLHLRQFSDFGIPAGTPSTVLSPSGQIMFPSLSAKRKKGLKTAERHGTGLRPSTDVSGAFIELLRADVDWADQLSGLQRLPPLPFEVQPMFNPTNEGPLFATASKIPTYVCLLSVLSMVSLDHGLLCDALAQFNLKLIQAVATFCADKIEVEKTNSNEQCVYWGSGSQVFPLVSLLGLGLRALGQSASQVPPASSIATLLSQWKRVVPTVLSSCPTNVTLLDGLACVGSRVRATLEIDHSGQIPVSVRAEVARLFSLDEFMELLPVFEANLSSFQHSIRLSTLKLMELFEQERFKPSDNSKEEDLVSPVSLLRSMEEIPATLESYREKANILRRLAVAVSNGRLPARYNRAFTLTTTSQLAVNLSLFWPEAVKALSAVADKLPDLFWDAVWHQLARLNDKVLLVEASLTPQSNNMYSRLQQHFGESFSHKQLPQLEGHHVECPFAYKLQSVYKRSEELFEPGLLSYQLAWHAIAASTPPNDRVDYWNVRVLLLKVLSEAGPSVAENHTKQLDPMFLDFVKTDMRINLDDRSNENDDDGEDVDEDGGDWSGSPDSTTDPDFRLLLPQSRKNAEKLLFGFLTLYSKFQHPEKGCEARRIYGLYLRLLMKGQPKLQCLALDCVLSWNDPAIKPYGENLKHLLDEIKFRDELHTFSLDPQGEAIHPEHREKLMPILLRILYGRIILCKGKSSSKAGMAARRVAVLSAMGMLLPSELRQFGDLILRPFEAVLRRTTREEALAGGQARNFALYERQGDASDDDDGSSSYGKETQLTSSIADHSHQAFAWISSKKQLGYLHLLGDMIKQLGVNIKPLLHRLLAAVLAIADNAQRRIEELSAASHDSKATATIEGDRESEYEDGDGNSDKDAMEIENEAYQDKNVLRSLRQLAVRRLGDIFALHLPGFVYTPYIECIYECVVSPRIDMLDVENTQAPSSLLGLLHVWSSYPDYLPYLTEYNQMTIPMLIRLLSAPKVHSKVISLVLDVIEAFVRVEDVAAEATPEIVALAKSTIRAQTPELLANINVCFAKESDNLTQNKVLLRGLEILSRISEHVSDAGNAKALLDLLLPLLRRPARVVSEKTKAHILEIFLKFLELVISDAAEHATAGQPESPRQRLFTQFYGLTSFGFSTIKSRDCRVLLCLVLEKLAKVDPCQGSGCTPVPLMPVVEVVTDLNAYSTKRLEEPDFDRRLAAFSRINDECWCDPNKLDARAWLPVLHNLVYFSQDVDEMSIRSNASHGLTRFIERVAQVLGAQPTPDEAEVQQFRSHMVHIVYVAIKRALDSQHKVVRSEYLAVLAHAVRKCGDKFVQLGDLRALDHEDEEASFFFNIQHIQLHRRIRALKRLVILINPDQDTGDDSAMEVEENAPTQRAAHWFRTSTLTKLLVPLFERFVFESDIQADHSLVAETINTLGAIGLVLPWESYYALLRKYLRIVRRKPDLERPLFRIVVSFLNNFHFDIKSAEASASVAEAHDAGSGNEQDKSAVADGEQDEGGGNEDEADEEEGRDPVEQADTTHRANHIHTVVVRSLVPEIKKHIFTEDEDKLLARIPLILACTRLLTMLPERTLRLQLPGVLTTLCNLLRSRHLSTRDAARETLLKTISLLGHAYVGFIIKELRSSLQRGYQRHILGYTIHAILNSLQNEVAVGSLDYTLDPIVSILCDDMFGETAQEKEASEKTGKIKEAQSNRAVDAFSILAKIVDLRHLGQLLAPLRDLLRETEATKVTRKVDAVLQAISQGVNANTEFDVPVVLTFCHGLIYQYSNMTQKAKEEAEQLKKRKELKAKLRADMEETYKIVNAPTELLTSRNYLAMNAHRFVEFGLNLVSLALKKRHFDVHDPEQLSMLNPFVDVAGNCLFLRYDSIVVSSLRILTALVKMPLPAFKCGVPVMVKRVFKILQDVPNTQSPTVHACFRLLISILRSSTCKDYAEITPKQLTFLVDFLRPDLEAPDRQATIFGLIRTIMLKKLMADAIYDLADTIKELMVTAQSSHTRSLCRQTWLHFMMEYPLGERRIKAAIAFLVQNAANYEFESGRESAMEAMSDMMQKFTDELFLPNAAEPFFFTLVVVLSSDDSNRCRQVAATLTRVLLTRMDAPRLGAVTAALKKWSDEILRIEGAAMPELEGSGDGTSASAQQKRLQLALTSLQVYGLLAEALEDRCKKRVPDILGAVHSALQVSLQCWKRLEKNEAEKYTSHTIFADNVGADSGGYPVSTSPSRLNWEMAYFAMNAFSKLVKAYPAGLFGPKQSGIWWLVVNHLNHPHLWIRMTSSRLLGQYFAESNPDWITQASGDCPQVALEEDPATDTPKLPSFNGPPKHVLMTFASIRTIAAKLLVQLKGKVLSDELAAQIVKNLFFVGKCLYKLAKPGKSDSADHSSPGSGDNSDDDDNGNNNEVASGNAEQDQQETVKLDPAQSLSWLIRKVAGVAKLELDQERTRTTRRTACFRWFAALSTAVEADYLIGQLVTILSPMYRTVEDEQVYHGAKKTQNDELRELGRELMTLIQKKVGTSAYFVAHNEIRTKIDKVRQERREKRKLLAITDPELHANRKLKRNKAKAESKKRRCEGNIKSKIRVAVARNRDGEL